MLSKQDDFIGHQLPTTFDHVMSSDPAWMERLWYTGHPVPGGDFIFDIGLGWHPNRNVMDGFAGVAFGGKQYNFRVSRRLRPDPLETAIGPLEIEILEGLAPPSPDAEAQRIRARLRSRIRRDDEPARGGRAFPSPQRSRHGAHGAGAATRRLSRLDRGRRRAARGQRADWLGQRDHSWGIRAEMRTDETNPPLTFYPPFFYCWTTAQFKDRGLHVFFKERAPGDAIYISGEEVRTIGTRAKESVRLDDVSHDIAWAKDRLGQTLESAEFEARFSDGSTRKLKIRALPAPVLPQGRPLRRPERLVARRRQGQVLLGARCLDAG